MQKIESFKSDKIAKYKLAQLKILTAKAYENENYEDKAFLNYLKAQKIFISIDSLESAIKINLELSDILFLNPKKAEKAEKYILDYISYFEKQNKSTLLSKGYQALAILKMESNPDESFKLLKKAAQLPKNNNKELITVYNNIGVLFNEIFKKSDSALIYYNKALKIILIKNNANDLCNNYINQAACYYYLGNHKKSIEILNNANSLNISKFERRIKSHIQMVLSMNYEALNDHKNAYKSLLLYQDLDKKIAESEQDLKISELEIKYQTEEKENENKRLKQDVKKNKILLLVSIGLLILVLMASFLAYKNLLNKKKIEAQLKLIENQKLENELKNQELLSIDSILQSQQKERQNIADELHDNLGSILATLKLNFENLKIQRNNWTEYEDKLYSKTNNLIYEAYQEVRNISHLKNLGSIVNKGLLKEIYEMAEKMSILNKLKINVIPFGLDNRIENSREIFIFRMIQELCTNIIKHSKAHEVNIYLTQHKNSEINIIVEDNGIGFDFKNIELYKGIGLKNIEKKVEQMGGTFSIDSHPGKGTTIIIDAPL